MSDIENFTEVYDRDMLEYVLKYKDYYKTFFNTKDNEYDPFILLEKYKINSRGSNKNMVSVNYTKVNNKGRRFAVGSLSLQNIPLGIRALIAQDFYYDIDFINCHPVIIEKICLDNKIFLPSVSTYNNNRENIINSIVEANKGLERDKVKRGILSGFYGGFKLIDKWNPTDWTTEFKKDIEILHSRIPNLFKDEYESRKELKKSYNLTGSTLSYIVCDEENKCLDLLLNFLKSKKIINNNFCVLCFDGIMIYNKKKSGEEIPLTEINTAINEFEYLLTKELNYTLKLKIKPFQPLPIEIPAEYQTLTKTCKEIKDYYEKDEYYWYDFITEMNKPHASFEALTQVFDENINRVMIRINTFEKNFIRKINSDTHLYFDTVCPRDVFTYYDVKNNGKIITQKISLYNLLYTVGFISKVNIYDDVDFKPHTIFNPLRENIDERKFNNWTGFKAQLLPEEEIDMSKINIILNHIKKCWANDDEDVYKYILSWFKVIFTNPSFKSKVALVLKSDAKQIGKGILINELLIPFIFGTQYSFSTAGLNSITERFNASMMNKLFINCDELSSLGDGGYHATFDIMKKRISDRTIDIEIKGGKKFVYPDYCNYLFCTNNSFTVKIEDGDCRYAIFESSPCFKGQFDYFNELKSFCNQTNANHFFSYICYLKDVVDDIRNVPTSELKKEMMISSQSSPVRFLLDVSNKEYELNDFNIKNGWINYSNLYDEYKKWADMNNERVSTSRIFSRDIKGRIEKKKSNKTFYNINSILELN